MACRCCEDTFRLCCSQKLLQMHSHMLCFAGRHERMPVLGTGPCEPLGGAALGGVHLVRGKLQAVALPEVAAGAADSPDACFCSCAVLRPYMQACLRVVLVLVQVVGWAALRGVQLTQR